MSSHNAVRTVSMVAAATLALGLSLVPQVLGPQAASGQAHAGLSLAMLGMAGGFVDGFGFVPDHAVFRVLFSPWIAWPAMALGLWLAMTAGR